MAQKPHSEQALKNVVLAYQEHGSEPLAAKAMKISYNTFRNRMLAARERIPEFVETHKPRTDQIAVRKLRDTISVKDKRLKEAERHAAHEETIREAAFSLSKQPLTPPSWKPKADKQHSAETIIMFLSDVHMGESVSLDAMGGRNEYSSEIAQKRIERYFRVSMKLATEHWSGPPPECIYLVLGGDMVSGNIHEELSKTNDLLALPAVKKLADCVAAGISHIREVFPKIQINVVSVPGNHGRMTRKPESKEFALDSYDTLATWMLESWASAKGMQNISFSAPVSGDALVNIYGFNFLFTHGDRIGSRGGAGFVGVAATATRGMKRLVEDYLSEHTILDHIVIGHFHTPLLLEHGTCNGSLVGPSEYSRSGRFKGHAASQWLLTVHPKRCVARRWLVQCGHESEGSIYRGKHDGAP